MFTQKISALPNNADGSAVQEAESDHNGSVSKPAISIRRRFSLRHFGLCRKIDKPLKT